MVIKTWSYSDSRYIEHIQIDQHVTIGLVFIMSHPSITMANFMALVGTEAVNIIEPNSTNIILGPIWIDLVTQTRCNSYLKNWQILGWTP